jgi:hypothetical protein
MPRSSGGEPEGRALKGVVCGAGRSAGGGEADQEGLLTTGNAPHRERPSEVVRDLERFLRTTLA